MIKKFVLLISFSLSYFLFNPFRLEAYEDAYFKRLNLWPLFVYSYNKVSHKSSTELLGPFIYKEKDPSKQIFSLRPLFTIVNTPSQKKVFFLSPLGIYKKTKTRISLKLVPIIRKTWEQNSTLESENNQNFIEIFPFFGGRDNHNATFGGIFPIYGNLKNFFGKKEITFVLWPVYTKVKYENYEATSYFWPFIRIVSSQKYPDKYKGAKLWPIFGKFKEGNLERSFVLWPFYIKEENKDPDFKSKKIVVFPLYAKEDNPVYTKLVLLWPFYQKVKGKNKEYYQLDFPWPFYRKIEGEDIKGRRFWPLFGWTRSPEVKKSFLLWPFYFHNEIELKRKQVLYLKKEDRFLLLSKLVKISLNKNPYLKEVRIWPIGYSFENFAKKNEEFFMPALFPFRDKGIEYNYLPLLTFIHKKSQNKFSETKFLWGLYRSEKVENERVNELAFLIRTVKGPQTNYVEFLEGLLGFGKIQGNSVCKLFFIPLEKKNENRSLSRHL